MQGINELLKKFKSISYETRYKGGRFALRKAANIVAEQARQNAGDLDDPETGRSIAANIALRWNGRLYKRTGNLGFRVGVLHGALLKSGGETTANSPTPHWRLLEFGTEKMKAQPFMRRALADNVEPVADAFMREYNKALDRAIKKGGNNVS